ncbi:MAG TPA: ATP-binding protein [Verrucomicrobiae bacterium]|nr:ATP-binding protein [Verrucomicrobiae bacterium]
MESLIQPPNPIERPQTPQAVIPLRVLIVDDSENDAILLLRALRKAGYEPVFERVSTAPAMRTALEKQKWEIVISDYEMPQFGGLEALQTLKESGLDLPFILVSAAVSEETAVAAMKAGAHDYIMKRKLARLGPAIERELREAQTRIARKEAEDALRQSEEQLRHTQKMDAVGRLAASVAHDFNNILTAIMGHTSMMLKQINPGHPLRKNAEPIEKCAQMAAALTKQLLAFSRKEPPARCTLQLNDAILNIEIMLRRLISGDIEFQTTTDPEAGYINADPNQIEQVIMNLVVNARDAMPNGGKLTIATARAGLGESVRKDDSTLDMQDHVLLVISDTGMGMSDEVKTHLFEPFYTTKPAGKGTGLGLATCFGIVKQNNGQIEVQSEIGKGTTFKIYFPRAAAPFE